MRYDARMRAPKTPTRRSGLVAALTAYADLAELVDREVVFWEGPIGFEGQLTGDGRIIEAGALTWDGLDPNAPLPLRYVAEDVGAHANAIDVGHIFGIERRDDGVIWAHGDIVLDSDEARAAAAQIADKRKNGVSMDLDDVAFVVKVKAEIVEEQDEIMEAALNESPDSDWTPPEREVDADGYVEVFEFDPDDEIMATTSARVRGATLVSIPAFADARISIVAEPSLADEIESAPIVDATDEPVDNLDPELALVAAAAPLAPPREWFADPQLAGPTPITITDDGRVYGHLATWDVCHIASPQGADVCVVAPRSQMGYARFHTGSLLTDDGETIGVGRITMGTGHAGPGLRAAAAAEHYDNTGTAVADVRAGEDAHGIWVAGALRPDVTPEQVRALRSSPLSGDWRRVDGNLELHAALAVNVPGFPIPRPAGLVASGELQALVASGVVADAALDSGRAALDISDEDLRYLLRLADRERAAERNAHRAKVEAFANRNKVAAFVAARQ